MNGSPSPTRVASPLRTSLSASVTEGMLAEVVGACAGGAVLTGWAMYLGCSPLVIGLMGALPFLSQFVQFPAAWLTSLFGHRRVAIAVVSASRLALVPLVALPFVPLSPAARHAALVAIASASALLGVVGNNAWVSWMGELVPPELRGRYFGRRTGLTLLSTTVTSLVAGLLLDRARAQGVLGPALSVLALIACVAGLATTALMRRQHDPSPDGGRLRMDLSAALLPLRDPDARRVLTFQVLWSAGVGFSATFYTLHMLKNLQMGFALVALYNAGVAAVKILSGPLWGKALDRVGARTVLAVCSFAIAGVPVLWVVPRADLLWPLAIDVLASGVLWGGHGLASFALPLSVAPRHGRPFYLAAFSTAAGLSFAAAAAVAGVLVERLPSGLHLGAMPLHRLHVIFLVSAVLRLGGALTALRIRERGSRPVPELLRMVMESAAEAPVRILNAALAVVPRPPLQVAAIPLRQAQRLIRWRPAKWRSARASAAQPNPTSGR